MRLLVAGLLLLFGFLSHVAAQELWTVQTAAFGDFRQASSQVAQLVELGFDAYPEFAMNDGRQFTRVRVGCFADRAAADAFARELNGRITAEAAPQPLSDGAGVRACVEWQVGFVKPQAWGLERLGADVVYRVELGGQAGYLRHDGSGWEFGHERQDEIDERTGAPRWRQVRIGGVEFVQLTLGSGEAVNACAGELVWQAGNVAVVERSDSVIACVVEEATRADGP